MWARRLSLLIILFVNKDNTESQGSRIATVAMRIISLENLSGMSEMLTLTETETSEMLLGHRQDLFRQSDDRDGFKMDLSQYVHSQLKYFRNTDAYTSN